MLIYDYKLRTNQAQLQAIDEAIRTVQFIRNKSIVPSLRGSTRLLPA
jgi:hypothetical protein